ncbi:Eco57I restriction-modification methylase domain-containing protein [Phormidesmis priestleyi]
MSNEKQVKESILRDLKRFEQGDLVESAIALFQTLGYGTDKRVSLDEPTAASFLNSFNGDGILKPEKARVDEWQTVDLLFQLTKDEIIGSDQLGIQFDDVKVDNTIIESYLFFGIRLRDESYSRSKLAEITREVNKLFLMPVMLVFQHGKTLTLSVINRRLSKRDSSIDVLEKVTLIKDIAVANPHRAHVEILADLSLEQLYKTHQVSNFVELHRSWQKTLDSSELNKRFFKEVSNWYFWATQQVTFPDGAEKNQAVRNATSVIRLITRLIFVWFLKEKGLVSDRLFDRAQLSQLIDLENVESSTYYKAILQNLFFATLNQEMNTDAKPENRKFRHQGKTRDQHYMVHNVYRYRELFKQPDAALALFETVPFLNGGLFECLDRSDKEDSKQISRIDGFSDRPDNPLSVPNFLFFCDEQKVDLNPIYGTKNKRYDVRGLIDIFNSYKFTIAENTPIEEEIALDPELLGKVFENLLAAYNPETEATARKQTGSFYTPREVVDYMVDESLIVYLVAQMIKGGLVSEADRDLLNQRLRHLFAYNTESHQFSDAEVAELINAIDTLKVLDPAVGSGAFPMGILQKLVFILRKLDPNNERWKQQQREREIKPVLDDIRLAKRINYDAAREEAIRQLEEQLQKIETDFTTNEMDYPRKLFLIENCIYGVDIQPVAVQISKLRFFISLIVEQTVNDDALNRGILPLPNLETKFIAANTLMGIERPAQLLLRNLDIEEREKQLKDVRHEFFKARTPATKQKYRDLDRDLRLEISGLLKTDGWSDQTADLLAKWEPYNQNASAEFFDPDWMFGVSDGFDVAIANPPYVRQESIKELKPAFKERYECFKGTADLYVYFYERAVNLLKDNGVLTYISSNKYFRAAYGEKLRQFLASQTTICQVIDFGDAPVFTAIAYPTIVTAMKHTPTSEHQFQAVNWEMGQPVEAFAAVVESGRFGMAQKELLKGGWQFAKDDALRLMERLRTVGTPLGDYVNGRFYYGIKTGLNEAFVVNRETRDRLIAEHPSSAEVLKPFLRGRDVKRWRVEYQDLWLIFTRRGIDINNYPAIHNYLLQYKDQLMPGVEGGRKAGSYEWYEIQDNIAYWQELDQPKVIFSRFMDKPSFAFDDTGFYQNNALWLISRVDEFLVAILNSHLAWWFLQQKSTDLQNGYLQISRDNLTHLSIPNASELLKTILIKITRYILYIYQASSSQASLDNSAQDKLMLEFFEQIINGLVYELYLPKDLHTAGCSIAAHLPTLAPIDSLELLRSVFEQLSHPDHPLQRNLIQLQNLDIIKLIEGKQ